MVDTINYVTYDADGNLTGAYLQPLQPEHADFHIMVSEAERLNWTDYRANAERDGLELIPPAAPPVPTEVQIVAAGMAAVQGHLDNVARSYGYDHILSMVGYADEPSVERYRLEGQAARAWRSLCWAKAEDIRDMVKAGARQLPTDAELIAEMPEIDLPYPGPFLT